MDDLVDDLFHKITSFYYHKFYQFPIGSYMLLSLMLWPTVNDSLMCFVYHHTQLQLRQWSCSCQQSVLVALYSYLWPCACGLVTQSVLVALQLPVAVYGSPVVPSSLWWHWNCQQYVVAQYLPAACREPVVASSLWWLWNCQQSV